MPAAAKKIGRKGLAWIASSAAPLVAGAGAIVQQASVFTPLTPEALELTLLANLTNPEGLAEAPLEARGQGMLDMTRGP
ncbi:hypothetical protein DV704_09680 [Meiothermus sp. QL-1]|uniref:hypothetical protein n=1 Tax=Meiothermus sp. QL-1 TaxID=2058095 RepID=UPI000E0A1208|nr:hypothetical protein [Meiothermus sp. QL-1]RDI94924.1 hypothetical protein DV704_09680 [Meiothermus sp. QL-1]